MRLFGVVALAFTFPLLTAAAEAIKPPTVTVQATPETASIERDDALQVVLVIANASERELSNLTLVPAGGKFDLVGSAKLPASLPPFATFTGTCTIKPRNDITYGRNTMLLGVRYAWSADQRNFVSMQTAAVPVDVKRPFEDEGKGLPGGTAALFNLLLPVFPAFFAYQLVDRLRKGEGLRMPTFETSYILAAFFIGLLANSLRVYFSLEQVLIGAAILGAIWPAALWAREAYEWKRWAFRPGDDEATYLEKALLGSEAPRRFSSITGKSLGESWTGVHLKQPDGSLVLGATLLATPTRENDRASLETLVADINNGAPRKTRKILVKMVRKGSVTLGRLANVVRGNERQPEIVATNVVGFEQSSSTATKLLTVTS